MVVVFQSQNGLILTGDMENKAYKTGRFQSQNGLILTSIIRYYSVW